MTQEHMVCPHRRLKEPRIDYDDDEIFFTCVDCGWEYAQMGYGEVWVLEEPPR